MALVTLTGVRQKDKVKVIFGMSLTKKDHYGVMLYHKNRLIKAYEKVGCQVKTGRGGFELRPFARMRSAAGRTPILISRPPDVGSKGRRRSHRCH